MHQRNLLGLFCNILFQNAAFLAAVPIILIEHSFRKVIEYYGGLKLMFLPRANFEIFGNNNF